MSRKVERMGAQKKLLGADKYNKNEWAISGILFAKKARIPSQLLKLESIAGALQIVCQVCGRNRASPRSNATFINADYDCYNERKN